MATKHTSNYQLHLWEPGDSFLREEFNENSKKVDGALAGLDAQKCAISVGTYQGNDTKSRLIGLDFTPTAVLLWNQSGTQANNYGGYSNGGVAFPDHPCRYGGETVLSVQENGFQIFQGERAYANKSGQTYYYLALH